MNKLPLLTTTVVLTLASAAGVAHATIMVADDPVLYWNDQAQALVPGSTPIQSRIFAIENIAIHDAVNATVLQRDHFYLGGVTARGGNSRAAASQAAHDVLVALNPMNAAVYNADLAASLALVPDGAAKTRGIATGAAFASAAVASRSADGSAAVVTYTTTGAPGDWRPTPPSFAPASLPQWGNVTPFLLTSGSQFRPGPPPALDSAAYTAAYNEVKDIGSATSTTRTADQTTAAKFWASGNASQAWERIALTLTEGDGKSTLQNARIFALLSSVLADSQIASYDAKYTYRFWRPVTAIQLGDSDTNAATVGDSGWLPLVNTPAFPSYVAAHATLSEAADVTLSSFFGKGGPICATLAAGTRCWTGGIDEAALDAGNSRLWGGIHYSFDIEAGRTVGYELGNYALSSGAFSPIPEPMSLAGLMLGAGAVAARRKRRARA